MGPWFHMVKYSHFYIAYTILHVSSQPFCKDIDSQMDNYFRYVLLYGFHMYTNLSRILHHFSGRNFFGSWNCNSVGCQLHLFESGIKVGKHVYQLGYILQYNGYVIHIYKISLILFRQERGIFILPMANLNLSMLDSLVYFSSFSTPLELWQMELIHQVC